MKKQLLCVGLALSTLNLQAFDEDFQKFVLTTDPVKSPIPDRLQKILTLWIPFQKQIRINNSKIVFKRDRAQTIIPSQSVVNKLCMLQRSLASAEAAGQTICPAEKILFAGVCKMYGQHALANYHQGK